MSTRALRKLQKSAPPSVGVEKEINDEHSDEDASGHFDNRFAMLEEHVTEFDQPSSPKSSDVINDEAANGNEKSRGKKPKGKKSKKAKTLATRTAESDNIDEILKSFGQEKVASANVAEKSGDQQFLLDESGLFEIEHRHLNPENELKRLFGKKVLDASERRPVQKVQRKVNRGGKLVKPKNTWLLGKTGLSMEVYESLPGGINLFSFIHSVGYQQAQILFWEAVDLMNPEAFVAILRDHPFHVDTLLQMSDVYRMNDDFSTAREFVERALYACESAFHPLFNIAMNNSRLDYRQQENRSFFLALFKHMQYMCQRACYRTALEFCKLIFSMDDEDPLGMLLMIDYLCLRSKQYDYLINLYHVLEAKRNLSQLPNFSYSVALACYLKGVENDELTEANEKLREALTKFPTMLSPLLDKCSVEPDKEVAKSEPFSIHEQLEDGVGLKQLISLYVCRCHGLWKEPNVMRWLETNVRELLPALNNSNNLYCQFRQNRRVRFQTAPLNLLRHAVLSDMKDFAANLPPEIREKAINNYDPLPPPDSRCAYNKPERATRTAAGSGSMLGTFLRSLLPNYNPEAVAEEALPEGVAAAAGGAGAGGELQRSVHALLQAMRDLLNDLQPMAAPREDQAHRNAEEDNNDDEWADDDLLD